MSNLMRMFQNSAAPIRIPQQQVVMKSRNSRLLLLNSFGERFRQSMMVKHLGRATTKCERPGCEGKVRGIFEGTGRFRFSCSDSTCFMRGQEKQR